MDAHHTLLLLLEYIERQHRWHDASSQTVPQGACSSTILIARRTSRISRYWHLDVKASSHWLSWPTSELSSFCSTISFEFVHVARVIQHFADAATCHVEQRFPEVVSLLMELYLGIAHGNDSGNSWNCGSPSRQSSVNVTFLHDPGRRKLRRDHDNYNGIGMIGVLQSTDCCRDARNDCCFDSLLRRSQRNSYLVGANFQL